MRLALAAALLLVLAAPALASDRHPTQGELERELVCPTCHTTLDESDAPIAREMKAFIRRRIRQGATKSQIENELVGQFGSGVLGVPRRHGLDLLAWALPLGGIGIAAALVAVGAWRWSRRGPPSPRPPDDPSNRLLLGEHGPELDPELDRRVDEELARFDA